jgi:plastocyanin
MRKLPWIAIGMSVLVLAGCGTAANNASPTTGQNPSNQAAQTTAATNQTSTTQSDSSTKTIALKSQEIDLTVFPGSRFGSDGKMHDTFSPGNFTVVAGVPVTLTVYNYDDGTHTLTNSALGLNLQVKGSTKKGVPMASTVTFTPAKAGDYEWQCMDPCDSEAGGWAMSHDGYMRGTIHVVPYNDKQYIDLQIKDGVKYAKQDGKLHDAYTNTNFTVQQGIPVQVTVENFDSGSHSLTDPGMGINQVFKGASKDGVPSLTTFTFTPEKTGTFDWHCAIPCDGGMKSFSMMHQGYMEGVITVAN